MSVESVAVVQRGFDYFSETGDFLDEIMAPDFVWDMSTFAGWPEQQIYHGVAGARQFIAEWTAPFDEWRLVDHELIDPGGDRVLAIMRQRARHRTTGMAVDMVIAQVFTVRDGLQTQMQMYADPDDALAAVGLER